MTDFDKVFIDTAPFIYFLENEETASDYCGRIENFLMSSYKCNKKFVTSVVTVEEYSVMPYKNQTYFLINMFEGLINTLGIGIVDIDLQIARKAAQIRAEYKGFKAMDALQLATACIQGCDLFLTNDKQLRQFKEVRCITLDEL